MSAVATAVRAKRRGTAVYLRLGLLVALAIGVPVALAYATGAMQIPRIDDWAFRRIALDLYSTGHFRLVGWGEMTMIGHELWGLPFIAIGGRSITALHWAGAVAAGLGVTGTFSLYRRFLPARVALFGTAAIVAIPSFVLLTATYMTDLTSYAGEVLCLTVGIAALRAEGRRSTALLVASLAVGFWAFSCRELSIAAPAAVILGELLRARREGRSLRKAVLLGGGLLVLAAALYLWRKGLPGDQPTPLARPGLAALEHGVLVVLDSYFAVALGLLPILLLCRRPVVASLARSRSARLVALAVAGIGVILLAVPHYPSHDAATVLDGNVLSRFGAGGPQATWIGKRAPLFPDGIWLALNAVAVTAGALLAGGLWGTLPFRASRRARRLPTFRLPPADVATVLLYTGLTAALLIFRAVQKGFLIDRYFLTVTMASGLLALLWLHERGRPSVAGWACGVAAAAVLSAVVVLDAGSYDKARWAAAEAAVTQGVAPTNISAGFEWIGAHHPGPIPASENILGFPRRCVVVAVQPLRDSVRQLIEARTYGPLDGVLERRLWVYREPRLCR